MWAALRSRSLLFSAQSSSSSAFFRPWKQGLLGLNFTTSASSSTSDRGLLDLQEIENVLSDVRADNVKVIPAPKHCDWADFMVVATGRSTWHVKNIAQALIYKAKQKQKGAARLVLPSVEGEEGGKWIVIDSGKVIVHALDEKAREYYNLEGLWTTDKSQNDTAQLEFTLVLLPNLWTLMLSALFSNAASHVLGLFCVKPSFVSGGQVDDPTKDLL